MSICQSLYLSAVYLLSIYHFLDITTFRPNPSWNMNPECGVIELTLMQQLPVLTHTHTHKTITSQQRQTHTYIQSSMEPQPLMTAVWLSYRFCHSPQEWSHLHSCSRLFVAYRNLSYRYCRTVTGNTQHHPHQPERVIKNRSFSIRHASRT